jgi:ribosomal protein S18 acetylase RimI-like enzyme
MREADARECAAYGLTPYEALALSEKRSHRWFEVWHEGELIAEWGWRLDSFLTGSASVWMLSFEPAARHRVFVARASVELMDQLLAEFTTLRCEVHAQYTLAVRWLYWLGFRVKDMYPVGDELFLTMIARRGGWES